MTQCECDTEASVAASSAFAYLVLAPYFNPRDLLRKYEPGLSFIVLVAYYSPS